MANEDISNEDERDIRAWLLRQQEETGTICAVIISPEGDADGDEFGFSWLGSLVADAEGSTPRTIAAHCGANIEMVLYHLAEECRGR